MSLAATQIRMWISGLVLLAFGAGLHAAGGNVGAQWSAGAAALIVVGALLVARTIAGSAILRIGGRPIGAPSYARTRRPDVAWLSDPDAPGRPRPRAPGIHPLH